MEEEQKPQTQLNQQTQEDQNILKIQKQKTSILVLGMAGSGKTTFVQKLQQKISQHTDSDPSYIVNLDPAVQFVPYTPQIDIREKIDIKKLMKSHGLGPNGGIVTAMNLFCTEIDKTIDQIQKQTVSDYVVVDTPGQIEVFSWSASGSIITQTLSGSMPTVLVYVIDIQRCMNANSFMSNMVFSLSIFYKMRLPMIVVFNKEDAGDKQKLFTWMKDYEAFLDALDKEDSYLSTLSKSMVLNLDEFYQELNCCAVSSTLGTGFEDFFPLLEKARQEYFDITLPDMEERQKLNKQDDEKRMKEQMNKFQTDKSKMEKEIVKKSQQANFNPMMNVFSVGGGSQQQQEQNKTIQDLKNKKQQMEQEQEYQYKLLKNQNNLNEVIIEEDIQKMDLNSK